MKKVEWPGTYFVERSTPVDLTPWGLELSDEASEAIAKLLYKEVSDSIAAVFREHPPHVWLPIQWITGDGLGVGDDRDVSIENPGTIYFDVPLGPDEDKSPVYATTLDYLIDDLIGGHVQDGAIRNPESIDMCERLAAHLRELADRLTSVCEKEQPR